MQSQHLIENWFGRVFHWFETRLDPFPDKPASAAAAHWYRYLKESIGSDWPVFLMIMISAISLALAELGLFGLIGLIINDLASSSGNRSLDEFLVQHGRDVFLLIACALGIPLIAAVNRLLLWQATSGSHANRMRWQGHSWLLGQSMSFYNDEFAGRVSSRLLQGTKAARDLVATTIDIGANVATWILGSVVLVALLDPSLAWPFVLFVCLWIVLLIRYIPSMVKIAEKQADARALMTGRIVDSYANINTVKLFAHGDQEANYARSAMREFLHTVYPQFRLVTGMFGLLDLINALLIGLLVWIGVSGWLDGTGSAGAVAVAITIALRLNGLSHWVSGVLIGLYENFGVMLDGLRMLQRERALDDIEAAPALDWKGGRINFEQVRFHYGRENGVLDSLDLEIASGEKIGLVGPSGAGKTTLISLLLRLYDVEDGIIRIDDQDIRTISQDSLRACIGVVSQDSALLHRSIRDNIAYGRKDATDEQILHAARQAEADVFIENLVDTKGRTGLDTHVGERGVKLSGGQRQRIAIARAFLKDAPILVLDEATSSLDSETEIAIQSSLRQLMAGKTVIAIAHRLSTIAAMDRLVILESGRVVEQGTHDNLIASGGRYADLWHRQSGGFISE
ncbi:MAG: ABC transporter ATP-binding protein [Granulosicoccus sp.]